MTRLIHLKKQWLILLFWLLFPIFSTMIIITLANKIQEDTKVPVGLVLEEETPLTLELYHSMKTIPLIRVYQLSETEAIDQLNKHQLDSVFVIRKDYDNKIRKGSRNRLVTGYQSDLSLAYLPVQEIILSYVQQDAGRSKAAHVVNKLRDQYAGHQQWTWDSIVEKSRHIQVEQQLLHTTFSFTNTDIKEQDTGFTLLKPWAIWSLSTLLSTFLLFDWLIKERRPGIMPRFAFMRLSLKSFLIQNLIIYVVLQLIFDAIALTSFYLFFKETITFSVISAVIFYRLLISLGAFLFALPFKNTYVFYSASFVVTLLMAIGSGALLPIDGVVRRYPWFEWINPLHAFLSMEWLNIWLPTCLILLTLWYVRKEKYYDSRR